MLLAVSGGVDSVVLAHLFRINNFSFAIAHCNFKLRSTAADQDADFVKSLATEFNVPFYTIDFETTQIASQRKQSIQVVARDLRYEWLEKIRSDHHFQYIATAHHINDSLETIIYNLAKGTGIRGISGIPIKNGKIIRPLLFTDKKAILDFANERKLSYREDASNASDKYTRNHIRHNVIPQLEKINPSLHETAKETIQHLQETESIFNWAIDHIKDQVVIKNENTWKIDLKKLRNFPSTASILFEIIHSFGFNSDQINQVLSIQSTNSGRQFFTTSHQLLVDRDRLIIQPIDAPRATTFSIEKDQRAITIDADQFELEYLTAPPSQFTNNKNVAYLDCNELTFPLQFRRWQKGDTFQPLGMNGLHQKLQDFLINQKLSIWEKENIWILTSKGKICWIAGHRLDHRFRITPQTTTVLKITLGG